MARLVIKTFNISIITDNSIIWYYVVLGREYVFGSLLRKYVVI